MSLPVIKCSCGQNLEAATAADGSGEKPSPGDYSLCLYCAKTYRFDENLVLVPIQIEEAPESDQEGLRIAVQNMKALTARFKNKRPN